MTPDILFTYGSLRAGGSASHLLTECSFLGTAATHGVLGFANGFLLLRAGPGWVHGELYRLPAGPHGSRVLEAIDRYEGLGEGVYQRTVTRVAGIEAWTYWCPTGDNQPDG